jgi:hypothetical protein
VLGEALRHVIRVQARLRVHTEEPGHVVG